MRTNTSAPLRASDLRHYVTISAPAGVLSADATVVVEREPASIAVTPPNFQRNEALAAGGLQTQTLYTVSLRYRTDLRADYAIVEECCTERRFQILSIVPSDRRDAIDMTCVTAG